MTAPRLPAVLALSVAAAALTLGGGRRHDAPRPTGGAPIVSAAGMAPARARAARVAEVSRAFLAAYIGFLYGRLSAAQLPGVSPSVRSRVAGERPDPPTGALASADPRLRSLRVRSRGAYGAGAVAVIGDRGAAYRIELELRRRRRPSGWTIIGLRETG